MSPPRRGRDSDPGGVDGADATGLRDRVARGLLAAPRDAEARPKVKGPAPAGPRSKCCARDRGGCGRPFRPPPRKSSLVRCAVRSPPRTIGLLLLFGRRAVSGGAAGDAAAAVPRVDLADTRERPLALLATVIANRDVVRPAGIGRGFLCMAGATVPHALAKGHGHSFREWFGMGASDMPRTSCEEGARFHGRRESRGNFLADIGR